MNTRPKPSLIILLGVSLSLIQPADSAPKIHGELKQWHRVTIDFTGPESAESATPNPFTDYRLDVRFRNGEEQFLVPGYFAADGDAANTGADSGSVWRVHFAPNKTGRWEYETRFVTGPGVAFGKKGKSAGHFDGAKGSFDIAPSDKSGRDFRGRGRLSYVGKHHLRFEGDGSYFLKCGADAPENFLAYAGFDGDFKSDGVKDQLVKTWQPHVRDWREGDPTWRGGKGKGIIGAVNYLADQGMNVFSFLTLNIEGDDRNVFPYTSYGERERLDCSRLDQWEILFEHATQRGMYLHFKTQEAENVNLLDGGKMGPQRSLYYRELIARFGHHLALNWNLGEEVGLGHKIGTQQKKDWAAFLWNNDPYHHHIVIHNGNDHYDLLGPADAGGSHLTGFSLQTNRPDFSRVHEATLNYIRRSVEAGKPWVVACDEPGDASHSLITDAEDPTRNNARINALWGNIMAGGAGVEWYFGYKHPHSDLTCQDYRTRAKMWEQCRHALGFFRDHKIPFWQMTNGDGKVSGADAFCLLQEDKIYVVFLKKGGSASLDLSKARGQWEIRWFNPREGGPLLAGSTGVVAGGGVRSLGAPPRDKGRDWVALVRPADPNRVYPPSVDAGANLKVMLAKGAKSVTVKLQGTVTSGSGSGGNVVSLWRKESGPGAVEFAEARSASTSATISEPGSYVLALGAAEGKERGFDRVTVVVEPYSARITKRFHPVEDAYLEGGAGKNNEHLKVEGSRRVAYLKFDVAGLPSKINSAKLVLTEHGDSGGGTLKVLRAEGNDWSEAGLDKSSAPAAGQVVGKRTGSVGGGEEVVIPVDGLVTGNGTYSVILQLEGGGNDIWFGSSESAKKPALIVVAEEPEG